MTFLCCWYLFSSRIGEFTKQAIIKTFLFFIRFWWNLVKLWYSAVLQLHPVSSKTDEKQKSFINSPFFFSEFQTVIRIVKIVHSAIDSFSISICNIRILVFTTDHYALYTRLKSETQPRLVLHNSFFVKTTEYCFLNMSDWPLLMVSGRAQWGQTAMKTLHIRRKWFKIKFSKLWRKQKIRVETNCGCMISHR